MALILTIENEQSLPNGAPVSVRLTDGRGVDIGRSATIDWSLPDPTRFISGRHCEVRFREGDYWLNDLSTNGTFLNDSPRRLQGPHKLRQGDRLAIGSYVIVVTVEAEADEEELPEGAAAPNLDAQIAEAIAAETAPPRPQGAAAAEPAADVLEAEPPPQPFQPPPRPNAPLQRPYTEVRARGFFATPAVPPAQEAPEWKTPEWKAPAPAEPAPHEAEHVAEHEAPRDSEPGGPAPLDPRELEAIAWSAPERPHERQPPAADLWDEPQIPQVVAFPAADLPLPASSSPAPAPVAAPPPALASAPGAAPSAHEFLEAFARGAGVPASILARQDGVKVAEELGALMRMAVENLTQLLNARFKAKRFARTSSQTMIQALDNNPLKFAPTPEDALKIMFGPRTASYLDAKRAFEGAFTDLKTHQLMTFAAMQQAVRMLVEDLDPKAIEEACGEDKGLAAFFGAHKARLWDLYLARWQAKTLRHEDGLVDAFMLYFAQCYDQAKDQK